MFSTMDIASGGNQQMHVLRSNQQHHHQPQAPPQQQQQVFQYGGYQQQQQQQPYFTAYPNACTQPSNNPPQQQQKPSHNNNIGFMQTNSYAMQPQQQMFPYGYQQPNSYMPPRQQLHMRGGGYNPNINHHHSGGYGQQQGPQHGSGRGRGRGGCNAFVQHYHQVHNNFFYNQQHHFSNNNAVPEKTPTLLVTHPTTKKVMSIKLNRIYTTMADLRPQLQQRGSNTSNNSNANPSEGSTAGETRSTGRSGGAASLVLCLDFLSPRGCVHGSGCDKLHVAGLEYMWDPIEVTVVTKDDVGVYTKGFRLHCYTPSLAKYYNIPSEFIEVTKGSADYVTMYNEHGDNFKMKFKVCAAILAKQVCESGPECSDIHCSLEGLTGAEELHSHATHINNAEDMQGVTRLPADMKVRVFDQNSANTSHDYMGTNVLLTEGAKTYAKYYMQELNRIPVRKRMQHCAHFRLKDMCRLGESCRFLHVLPTPEEIQQRLEREREVEKAEGLQALRACGEENF